jgi:hypothetical protein
VPAHRSALLWHAGVAILRRDSFASLGMTHGRLFMVHNNSMFVLNIRYFLGFRNSDLGFSNIGFKYVCQTFSGSGAHSTTCQGRPYLLSASMNLSGYICSMLYTPAPCQTPVSIIIAPIIAGTPVV